MKLTSELVIVGLDFLFLRYAKSDLPEYKYTKFDDIDNANYKYLCGVLERAGLITKNKNTFSITENGEKVILQELIKHGFSS